jgi:glycosyltransferase involved in cell wall biosynthesis
MLNHLEELGVPHENFTSIDALSTHLKSANPDIVMADDNPPQLRISRALRKSTGISCATYAQILLGSQSIVDAIDSSEVSVVKRMKHRLSRLVPFSAFRAAYKGLLGKDNSVICNSRTTATLLQVLYGVEPEGVVYPPVDQGIFFPIKKNVKKGALVYLGSFGLDTDPAFIREIIRTLQDNGEEITAFGNREFGTKLARDFKLTFLDGCTDDELAAAYSSSAITICPQKWELFGYVVAESISCGTPVLAFNCMGPGEILTQHGGGVLVNRKEDFLSVLSRMEDAAAAAPEIRLDGAGFGLQRSASELGSILERACARRK